MRTLPIYLDHHATTPVDPRVVDKMLPYLREHFGNPASVHRLGAIARAAVDGARAAVASLLGADISEIVFTSGATESDNLAIKGVARALAARGRHIITTAVEHRGVLESCKRLEREGWRVSYVQPDSEGRVDPQLVAEAVSDETVVISVMLVNNEVGTVLDVGAIGAMARARGIVMHTDAAQGVGKTSCDVARLHVDLLSLSAHKIYGPKGVGALYIRREGARAPELLAEIEGGGQELGYRSGTLNVPGIVGLGAACEILSNEADAENQRVVAFRDRLRVRLTSELPEVRVNGADDPNRHPGNLHVSIRCVDAASLMVRVADRVACSIGSACASGSGEPSYVLRAMGRSKEEARTGIRFGIGRGTTAEEIEEAADCVVKAVRAMRAESDAWALFEAGVDPDAIDW